MLRLVSRLSKTTRPALATLSVFAGVAVAIAGLANTRGHAEVKMTQWVANIHPENTPENLKVGRFLIEGFSNAGIRGFYWGAAAGILTLSGVLILIDEAPLTIEDKKRRIKKLQAEVINEEAFAETYAAFKEVKTHDDV